MPLLADVIAAFDELYPPETAESWDAVGLVCGDPADEVRRVLFTVDVVESTVDEALDAGVQLVVAHHPLLLRGVHGVPVTTHKGRAVHRLIRAGVALFVAHTNADVANPGVSDALANRLGLQTLRPLVPIDEHTGHGRIGELPSPVSLRDFTAQVAAAVPASAVGVRASGHPDRPIRTVAVCGGAGDSFLSEVRSAGVDAYVTADLRHHPVSESGESGGPALLDVGHWSSERPWLDSAAKLLSERLAPATVENLISDLVTDPWTVHAAPERPPTRSKETSNSL